MPFDPLDPSQFITEPMTRSPVLQIDPAATSFHAMGPGPRQIKGEPMVAPAANANPPAQLLAHYRKALDEGHITQQEYQGFVEAMNKPGFTPAPGAPPTLPSKDTLFTSAESRDLFASLRDKMGAGKTVDINDLSDAIKQLEPLSRSERDWQNYGRYMSPDDVLNSEVVWGRGALYKDQGLGRAEGFAAAANELWQRMGANRYITVDWARRYMSQEIAKRLGLRVIETRGTQSARQPGEDVGAALGQGAE